VTRMLPLFLLLFAGNLVAQEGTAEGFSLSSSNSLQFSQVALSNWSSGGESSLALNGAFTAVAQHRQGRISTDVAANWMIGVFKSADVPVRKTNDQLTIVGISGFHFSPNFGVGVLADLSTQVAPSYIFERSTVLALGGDPVKGIKTGDFLSPGSIELGLGFRLVKAKPLLDLILAPLMMKQTVILDKDTRALDETLGLYGNEGKTVRSEAGAYLKLFVSAPLMENVTADGKLKLFANYADQDVDSSLVLNISGKINQLLSASIHTTLLHDNDVDTDAGKPGKQNRVQIREIVGLNLTYAFHL
jgi:hypothetical protein